LSIHVPSRTNAAKADPTAMALFFAVDNITICDILAGTIDDYCIRRQISNYMNEIRDALLLEFNQNNGRITKKYSEHVYGLWESLSEILAEADEDDSLIEDLSNHL